MVKIYFAGQRTKEDEAYIRDNNASRLLSYYREQRLIDERVDNGYKTFVDSGAFSAHTKGAEIDVDEYIQYLNARHEQLECYAQLDTIPGEFGKPKTKKQLEEAPEKTWENYLYMYGKLDDPSKLIPIFHQGEDFKHLKRMLEHKPVIEYIGISPANDVSTQRKSRWIKDCFRTIRESSNPGIKTHAFGLASLYLLRKFPFYSADATTWIIYAINGIILTERGNVLISDKKTANPAHIAHQPNKYRENVEKEVVKKGFTMKELEERSTARTLFNIRYYMDWQEKSEQREERIDRQGRLF